MNNHPLLRTSITLLAFSVASAVTGADSVDTDAVDFVRDVQPIFQHHCYSCHGAERQRSGLRLDIKSEAFRGGDNYGDTIVAGKSDESVLIELVASDDPDMRMPPKGNALTKPEIETLIRWINQGAIWPDGVDLAELKDLTDHWSFQPLAKSDPPRIATSDWPRNDIDRFIYHQLAEHSLQPSNETDRRSWLRRVYLDLIGLPPSPSQFDRFLSIPDERAYEQVVETLLSSPRYGERWAQHWLDVVRYADTDGFEVNTERPHAWPYRDYVIDAFNQDTPYDQFIREQLAGDAFGRDPATGFLVTAAALLPGQIGQDEESKRLARQDELNEIIVNTGEAFLGLSIGCARCHDHKFDPITQRDYYSMQAFFSGVRYGNRPIKSPESIQRQAEIEDLKERIGEIDHHLDSFVPIANVDASVPQDRRRAPVSAKRNIDRFPPVNAVSIRFTILATNNLAPCIDELEVYDTRGENVALASTGTRPVASGSLPESASHRLEHINDGQYGNEHSWISDTSGGGWVELHFDTPVTIERVVWGRDRDEKYDDRLAIEYSISVTNPAGEKRIVANSKDRRIDGDDQQTDPTGSDGLTADEAAAADKLRARREALLARVAKLDSFQSVFAGTFTSPEPTYILSRGDPEQPGEPVVPNVITALGNEALGNKALGNKALGNKALGNKALGNIELGSDAGDQRRRLALANWIADPENPLTARVMVNRIWQYHFGTGLVATSSDFGWNGAHPTHPELLDWLADQFITSGWSVKSMHRMIVLSATYRQSSQIDRAAQEVDADTRLLWRYPSRRLEAEAIRDSMLAVSGNLNLTIGGPGFNLFRSRGGLAGFPPIETFSNDGMRRMIYAHKIRMEREIVFGAFDCPDAGQSMPRRRQSTTPIQALNLMNSKFTIDQAEVFAGRLKDVAGQDQADQIQLAYEIAYGRQADSDELQSALQVATESGLSAVCRAIFNSNEFLFLP